MDDPPAYRDPSPSQSSDPDPPLYLPGAGTFVLSMLLVSLSMLFIASIAAYLIVRSQIMARSNLHEWPPPGLPGPPASLWLSTVIILASSVTVQLALSAVRREVPVRPAFANEVPAFDNKPLVRWLLITFALGIAFLIVQLFNWFEFYRAIPPAYKVQGPYLGMFFTLTGLHAAHVIGGLIPLGVVACRALRSRYSRNFHPGVRYVTLYWHFLDVIWLALFVVLMLL